VLSSIGGRSGSLADAPAGRAGRARRHQLLDGCLDVRDLVPVHYVSLLGGLFLIGFIT
jgi:hypothetical protein